MHVCFQLCPTLCKPMDWSLPGFFVHGDFPGKNTGVDCHFLLQGIFLTQGSNIISWVSWMASRFFIADFLKWNSCYTTTLAIRPLTSHSLKTKEHSNNGELFDPKSWVKNISAPTESEWEDTRTKNQLHFSLMENLKIPGKLIFNCTPTHPHTHTHTLFKYG